MDIRTFLRQRLKTLTALTAGGALRRGLKTDTPELEDSLAAQWKTEARLIQRVLDEPDEPVAVLHRWRERTEQFRDRYPEREGWTDQRGQFWRVDLVLTAIDNLLEHIESWEAASEFPEGEEE